MNHRTVPLEHTHARFEKRPVSGPREQANERNVGSTRHEQANIDTVPRGGAQRLHVCSRTGVIGVGQPECFPSHRRDQLIDPEQTRGVRNGGDDAHRYIASLQWGLARRRSGPLIGCGGPGFGKRRHAALAQQLGPRRVVRTARHTLGIRDARIVHLCVTLLVRLRTS